MSELVRVEIISGVGVITLNSEKSLNALNQEIIEKVFKLCVRGRTTTKCHVFLCKGPAIKRFVLAATSVASIVQW